MLQYVFGVIALFIILGFLYLRIKFQFWSLQPVFHYYDLYYWMVNVGVIRHELPEKNKFVNLKRIKTIDYANAHANANGQEPQLAEFVSLLQSHYFRNGDNAYKPKSTNVHPYFVGHNAKTFLSYYVAPEVFIDSKTNKTMEVDVMIGAITSRPLHVILKRVNAFDVYYVDYLCVKKGKRGQQIAPQLIQTHEYNQSYQNRKISVSLFKREEELTGIIPVTVYTTYCFPLHKIRRAQPLDSKSPLVLLTGDKENVYYLFNAIKDASERFVLTVFPEITNVMELMATQNLMIKMFLQNGEIQCAYFFKKTCTFIKGNDEIVSLIASINVGLSDDEFLDCFYEALVSVVSNKESNESSLYRYLCIEDISDNYELIQDVKKTAHPIAVSPTAYYWYNFAYNTLPSSSCVILN